MRTCRHYKPTGKVRGAHPTKYQGQSWMHSDSSKPGFLPSMRARTKFDRPSNPVSGPDASRTKNSNNVRGAHHTKYQGARCAPY